jgi:hypothetical protein
MLWIESKTPEDARRIHDRLWGVENHESDGQTLFRARGEGLYEGGEFWADTIAGLKDRPRERLALAMRHLPVPAAFTEAAAALRAIIREKRKQKTDCESELRQLHFLAAIQSFCIPYAPRLRQPGYNVLARVPFAEFQAMPLTWESLGCDRLALLSKTDRKWMVEAWGEPPVHTTAHEKHRLVWDRYEDMLLTEHHLDPPLERLVPQKRETDPTSTGGRA